MILKKQLGSFDVLEIFSDRYIKVCRKGKYNLIDNDGRFVSEEWFDAIERKCGGADIVINGQTRKCRSVDSIARTLSIGRMLSDSTVLSALDIDNVNLVSPRKVNLAGKTVVIIAEVEFFGEQLFLSEDGRLFTRDYKSYEIPRFAVSYTDICRLVKATQSLSKTLNSAYRADEYNENGIVTVNPVWVFGFGTQDKFFSSCRKKIVDTAQFKPWGGDTIKLRFDIKVINAIDNDTLVQWFTNRTYEFGKEDYHDKWFTRQFKPEDVDEVIKEMETLRKDFSLA